MTLLERARIGLIVALVGMLAFSAYGTLAPTAVRCGLPGSVGCPGGIFGPTVLAAGTGEQWFTVTLFDYGFWIVDSTTGANESTAWNVFEGWTIHVNATSATPDASVGGTAYHGLGIEINATGQQLLSLAAPVGTWTPGSFVAPLGVYHHQHIWCTIECGPGHGGQQAWVLNVIPSVPLPKAVAASNVSSGSAPLTVSLTGTASAGTPPYNATWDFGDGSPHAFGTTASHTYTLGGDYAAQFRVTDAKGMIAASSVAILVNSTEGLRATASTSLASAVAPFSSFLSVVAHGGSPPYSFVWTFGDGSTLAGSNATQHLYRASGVYAAVATVRDAAGTMVRALTSIRALPPLGYFPVGVSATPPNGSAPIIVQLSATPFGGVAPYRYLWVLGDGSMGTGVHLTHVYNQTGSYEVNLFVAESTGQVGSAAVNLPFTAPRGGNGTDERPILGSPTSAAIGSLTVFPFADPSDGGSPLTVNASASVEAGTGMGESINWSFGDGTTATGPVVSHRFQQVGTYTVAVTATDSGGNHGSNSTVVDVRPLAASVAANRTSWDPPFSLDAAVTLTGGTGRFGAVSWTWGDGTGSVGDLLNHTFAPNASGDLTIHASATDSLGAPVTGSLTVHVNPPLLAAIAAQFPSSHLPPIDVRFTLTATGGTGSFSPLPLWGFGDGSGTRAGNLANHSYAKFGSYRVLVRTNDSLGTLVLGFVWVNLTALPPKAPPGFHGSPPWSLTGVSDPNRAALILIGIVAISGLVLVARRRQRATPTARPKPKAPDKPVSRPPVRPTSTARGTPVRSAPPLRPMQTPRAAKPPLAR
ncbi:MAG: PKD domain-containing protein [Thermoplasmata archaeon]|nr:PKD domain-containing protein [Thermoplasmata archaeon]